MKWIFIILIIIFGGWMAAVFLTNGNETNGSMSVVDSLQNIPPLAPGTKKDSTQAGVGESDTIAKKNLPLTIGAIDTKSAQPQQVVEFAKTLIGVPYLYGSTDPENGFDCSGFITYVFNRFGISVPRSSIDFTYVGKEVSAAEAKQGDLILFTGTDSADRFVGHMGIVVSNSDTLRFIHSTSGKKYGVTITPLNGYYQKRYVKTVRVF